MKIKCPECTDGELKKDSKGVLICDGCGFKKKAKKDSADMERVTRQDVRDLYWEENTEAMKETEEGYLVGRAAVTNIGVFPYRLPGGSVRMELRLPEEVFAQDSLDTLKMKPLTDGHPTVRVDAGNVDTLGIGMVGESIFHDPYRVYAPVTITKADAVSSAKNGKVALSCGYDADMDFTPGNWMGQKYDAIQRNIRYNHLALVKKGRAGDDVVLRLDSVDGYHEDIEQPTSGPSEPTQTPEKSMKTLILDSAQFEVDDVVHAALTNATTKLDVAIEENKDLKKDHADALDTLQATADAAVERADKADADLKVAQEASPAKLDEAVAATLALHASATKAGVEFKVDESEKEIKTKVILAVSPNAKLDDASDVYLQARFDTAMEQLEAESEADRKNRLDALDHEDEDDDQRDKKDKKETKLDSYDSRQRMIDNMNADPSDAGN